MEEYRHELQDPIYLPSEQHGEVFHDLLKAHADTSSTPQPEGCLLQSMPQGLVEFTDFGPFNNHPISSAFLVSPGHPDITGKAHFSFLDAYGARLVNGEVEVLLSDEDMSRGGFLTKAGNREYSLAMHYETAALGYGRGDSQALAPPLRIRAVSRAEVLHELSASGGPGGDVRCYW
jgi:hypothetical protein